MVGLGALPGSFREQVARPLFAINAELTRMLVATASTQPYESKMERPDSDLLCLQFERISMIEIAFLYIVFHTSSENSPYK